MIASIRSMSSGSWSTMRIEASSSCSEKLSTKRRPSGMPRSAIGWISAIMARARSDASPAPTITSAASSVVRAAASITPPARAVISSMDVISASTRENRSSIREGMAATRTTVSTDHDTVARISATAVPTDGTGSRTVRTSTSRSAVIVQLCHLASPRSPRAREGGHRIEPVRGTSVTSDP